jgi:hypothetical protein
MNKKIKWDLMLMIFMYHYIMPTFIFIAILVISNVTYGFKFINLQLYLLINVISIIIYSILIYYKYGSLYNEHIKKEKLQTSILLNIKIKKFVTKLRKDRISTRNIAVKIYVSQNMYNAIPVGYIVSDDIQFIVDDRKDDNIGFSYNDKQITEVGTFFY